MGGALAAGQAGAAGGTGGAEAGGAGGALSGQGGDAGGGQAGVGGAAAACELPATLLCDCKSPRSPTARGEWTCPPGATEKVCDCTSAPPPPKDVNLTACNDADGSDESHKAACVGDTEFPVCQVIVEGKSWVTSYCANPKSGPKKLDNGGIFFDVKCCKPIEPLPPMGVRIAA